jgi:spore coat protein U-like protein
VRYRRFVAGAALALSITSARSALSAGSSCQITNLTPLSFGAYTAGQGHPLDSTGELDVACSGSMPVQISMGRGMSGRVSPRGMTYLGSTLAYNIFQDAACTAVWGDGTGGSQIYAAMVTMGQTLRLQMFGRIYALQSIPPGVYRDVVTVVVVF